MLNIFIKRLFIKNPTTNRQIINNISTSYYTDKKGIGLQTDLEPDDVFANFILNKKFNIHHVVVGEGSADIKHARILKYLELLNSSKTICFRGQSSNKLFDKDGKEFHDLKVNKGDYDSNQFVSLIKTYIHRADNPVMVFLKPPRELMECFTELKNDLKCVTSYFYGGFNFRCLMPTYKNEQILEMLDNFREVHIYESFHATGSNNTINKNSEPKLYQGLLKLRTNNPYIDKLFDLTRLWNSSLMIDCYDTCKNLLKKQNVSVEQVFAEIDINNPKIIMKKYISGDNNVEKFYRNWKGYTSIFGHEDFQYVMADMCAVTTFFSDRLSKYRIRGKINFDKFGYSSYIKNDQSNLYYYNGIPRDELINEMISELLN